MLEWMDVQEQILRLLPKEQRQQVNRETAAYENVHKALASGFLRNICQKKEKNAYLATSDHKVIL